MSELRLAWASHDAARHACVNWHYAGVMPISKLVKVGVWEDAAFKGVVIFSRGASPYLGKKYALDAAEVCELTRVALRDHDAPVSRIVAIALRMLKKSNPGLRLVVSFADPMHDHRGGIYQAGNWVYTGMSSETVEYLIDGRWRHTKSMYVPRGYGLAAGLSEEEIREGGLLARLRASGQLDQTPRRVVPGKHRYLYPLDAEMRDLVELLRRPYPKAEAVRPEG